MDMTSINKHNPMNEKLVSGSISLAENKKSIGNNNNKTKPTSLNEPETFVCWKVS